MDNKYLDLFKSIWDAPAGKQIIAILMIIPIAMGFFFNYYYEDIIDDKDLQIKELKSTLKSEEINIDKINSLYISSIKDCNRQIRIVDSIHVAKLDQFRDKVENKYSEDSKKLEKDYKEVLQSLTKTRKVNEKTTREIHQIN